MNDFEQVLDNCINDLASGASNLDECLARHPEHAEQLRPLLLTIERVEMGRDVQPSAAFRARARADLKLHMQAHPRKRAMSGFTFQWRPASAFAILVLAFLVTGTAYAQGVLPGDPFYDWKLVSERAWRIISRDPAGTDLEIANRRIGEINVVVNDPTRRQQAMEGYHEVVNRLESEFDAETLESILPPIDSFDYPVQVIPTSMPTLDGSATPFPEDPDVISTTVPGSRPTRLPKIIPTIRIPPPIR